MDRCFDFGDKGHLRAWDEEYQRRGRLWAGSPPEMPTLEAGSRVLELGCGSGKALSAMLAHGWRVAALDVSPVAVGLCRDLLTGESWVEVLVADGSRLPFVDGSFDAVFAYHVAGHLLLKARKLLASEIIRVLRSGGGLYFRDFGKGDMRFGTGEEIEPGTFRRGSGVVTHYFSEIETEKLFSHLRALTLKTERWKVRIRGQDQTRAEVVGFFTKGGKPEICR